MKFDWWRRVGQFMADIKKRGESAMSVPHVRDQSERASEARDAVKQSQALLRKIDSMEGSVDAVHKSMVNLNQRNGFAAMILETLRGDRA